MSYEYFYPGSPYSLEPEYGELFTGYRVKAGDLGATTSIQTANQLKEVSNLLNQGMKVVEVSTIQPEVFEMIPKQQLSEINRLSKLTGTETTLHAPIIDPSGFTQQGWNETERENTERQFENVIERAHDLNPDGNIPVTIHASGGIPGAELMKDPKTGLPIQQRMIAVNQETGELSALPREEVYYPGEEGKILQVPEEKLALRNNTQWDKGISNLNFYKKEADEMIDSGVIVLGENYEKIINGEIRPEQLNPAQQKGWNRIEKAGMMLSDISSQFISFYDQAKKYIDFDEVKDSRRKNGAIKLMENINEGWRKEAEKGPIARLDIVNRSRMLDDSVRGLNNVKDLTHAPKIFKPVEDFVKEKASETLSNVAIHGYKKFGEKAPIVSIENPAYGGAMATGSDLKNLVEETREKFRIKLMKEGASSSQG
jgi:urease gamma subunit